MPSPRLIAPRPQGGTWPLHNEVRWTIDVLQLATDDARHTSAATKHVVGRGERARQLAAFDAIIDRHRELWLARNRAG